MQAKWPSYITLHNQLSALREECRPKFEELDRLKTENNELRTKMQGMFDHVSVDEKVAAALQGKVPEAEATRRVNEAEEAVKRIMYDEEAVTQKVVIATKGLLTQEQLDERIVEATKTMSTKEEVLAEIEKVRQVMYDEAAVKQKVLMAIDGLFTQEQLDQRIGEATRTMSTKEEVLAEIEKVKQLMYDEDTVNQKVALATEGLFSQEQLDPRIQDATTTISTKEEVLAEIEKLKQVMYDEEAVNQKVALATEGMFSQEQFDQKIRDELQAQLRQLQINQPDPRFQVPALPAHSVSSHRSQTPTDPYQMRRTLSYGSPSPEPGPFSMSHAPVNHPPHMGHSGGSSPTDFHQPPHYGYQQSGMYHPPMVYSGQFQHAPQMYQPGRFPAPPTGMFHQPPGFSNQPPAHQGQQLPQGLPGSNRPSPARQGSQPRLSAAQLVQPDARCHPVGYTFLVSGSAEQGLRIADVNQEVFDWVNAQIRAWREKEKDVTKLTLRCVAIRAGSISKQKAPVPDLVERHACKYCVNRGIPCMVCVKDGDAVVTPLKAGDRPVGATPKELAYYKK